MKRLGFILFAVIISIASVNSFSQSLYFCEGVDDDGYAINPSSVFNVSEDGGYLYFLVRMGGERINCDEVLFDIYRVNSGGEETFDNTIYQDVEPGWSWFWKQINFYDSGTYKVYAYDEDWKFLASGTVKVKSY